MHPTILIKRRAMAVNRLISQSEAIITHLELDPSLAAALHPQGIRDTHVKEMMMFEGLASLMDEIAAQVGVTEPVTVVTPAADEPPAGEVGPTADEAETPIPVAMGPDGLPAPTLDETPTAEQPIEDIEEEALPEAAAADEAETAEVESKSMEESLPARKPRTPKKPKGRKRP